MDCANGVGGPKQIQQTALIVNPTAGGPPVKTLALTTPALAQTQQIAAANVPASNKLTFTATTGRLPASVHWAVDVNSTEGDATGGATAADGTKTWTFDWDLGNAPGASKYVYDGSYTVSAQAFDARGVAGTTKTWSVLLNRSLPFAPSGLVAGRDPLFTNAGGGAIVDVSWSPNLARDIIGYRVYRTDPDNSVHLACDTTLVASAATNCVDQTAPAAGTLKYSVVAVDRTDLADATSAKREGAATTVRKFRFPDDRPTFKELTTQNALEMLRRALL